MSYKLSVMTREQYGVLKTLDDRDMEDYPYRIHLEMDREDKYGDWIKENPDVPQHLLYGLPRITFEGAEVTGPFYRHYDKGRLALDPMEAALVTCIALNEAHWASQISNRLRAILSKYIKDLDGELLIRMAEQLKPIMSDEDIVRVYQLISRTGGKYNG